MVWAADVLTALLSHTSYDWPGQLCHRSSMEVCKSQPPRWLSVQGTLLPSLTTLVHLQDQIPKVVLWHPHTCYTTQVCTHLKNKQMFLKVKYVVRGIEHTRIAARQLSLRFSTLPNTGTLNPLAINVWRTVTTDLFNVTIVLPYW